VQVAVGREQLGAHLQARDDAVRLNVLEPDAEEVRERH
jgi:hypothetical protein